MREFINQLPDWVLILCAALSFLLNVGGVSAAATSLLKQRHISQALKEAKERQSYIICPHCKKKTPLSEVSIHLVNGEVDNNLNGVPDSLE